MELAIETTAAAFRKMAIDEAVNIPRQRCQTDHVMLHVLPAAAKTLGAIGFKAYTVPKTGEAKFHVTLFDPKQGGITAIVEADVLGQFRTGAASGVARLSLSVERSNFAQRLYVSEGYVTVASDDRADIMVRSLR